MKIPTKILAALFFFSCCSHAQTFNWNRCTGGSMLDMGYATHASNYHHVYSFGGAMSNTIVSPGCGTLTDVHDTTIFIGVLTKRDSSGACLWTKLLRANPGGTCNVIAAKMRTDASENLFLFATYTGSIDVDPGTAIAAHYSNGVNENFFLAKYSPTGNLLWSISLQPENPGNNWMALEVDKTGNVYLGGAFTNPFDADFGTGTTLLTPSSKKFTFVTKYSSSGAMMWAYTFGASTRDFAIDNSNNLIIAGSYNDTTDIRLGGSTPDIIYTNEGSVFLGKYNGSGQKIWTNNIRNSNPMPLFGNYPEYVRVDAQDNIYMTGIFRDTLDFDPGPSMNKVYTAGGSDVYISRYTGNGAMVWADNAGGADEEYVSGFDVANDGQVYLNILACSDTFDIDFSSAVFNFPKVVGCDIIILNTNQNGALQKHFTIATPYFDNYFNGMDEFDGALYLNGFQNTLPVDYDPAPTATFAPVINGVMDITLTKYFFYPPKINRSGIEEIAAASEFYLYPNPTKQKLHIQTSTPVIFSEVIDIQGRKVLSFGAENEPDISSLHAGVYLLRVNCESGYFYGKFVVGE